MHDDPTVTVLMPVRNGAVWLEETLASLRAQTHSDYEIVAVDDGSIDDSGRILAAHAEQDPRIRVFSTRADDGGLVAALNLGLNQARGRYVARMDADDVAHPYRLSAQTEWLRTDDSLAAVSCQVEGFPPAELGRGMA
jgi:glycosyltransferase involved in cell wall biosynthesis